MLERLVDAYPDEVRYIYRHFPLITIHDNAQKAAEAAEAAGRQDAFWDYHHLLFSQADEWSPLGADEARTYFLGLAEFLRLDVDQFAQDLDGNVFTDYVSALRQEAINLGLTSTPSAIIDGFPADRLPGDYDVWSQYVSDRMLLKELESRQYDAPPELTINLDATYLAHVEMETGGTFTIELLPQSAPQTVNSFVFLAEEGWFDGVTFHRVLTDLVAQTGDPTGTGLGGPGYVIPNEIDPALSHDHEGVVAMANSGPDTNGSQWYITLGDVSQLDGSYTIFGQVVEGMDVVRAISPRDPESGPNLPPGDSIHTVEIEVR